MLEKYNYELVGHEVINGETFANCLVTYKDGSPFDKFKLVIDENGQYLALTMDTRFKVYLRRAIEKELNLKLLTA